MISLEMAKRLKEAGLKWEPQEGDWFYEPYNYFAEGKVIDAPKLRLWDYQCFREFQPTVYPMNISGLTFAPRLDQLLAKIDKSGHKWQIYKYDKDVSIEFEDIGWANEILEEAATEALLWLLEQ